MPLTEAQGMALEFAQRHGGEYLSYEAHQRDSYGNFSRVSKLVV